MENIVIIGSGPAGLSAGVYASRAMLNPLIIEGISSGGQLMLTSEVENYPGIDNPILGPKLIEQFRNHALKFGSRLMNVNVEKLEKTDSKIILICSDGSKIETKSVLITTGADAKWLGLESEQRLRGKGVSACATCDGFFFKDKRVAVVGGGDSAMEEALYLTKFASEVTIIHRRESFRASKIMQERVMNNSKIKVLFNTEVKEVLGTEKVEGLLLLNNGVESKLELEGLFIAIGHIPSTKFLENSGVKLDEKGYIITRESNLLFHNLDISFPNNYRYSTSLEGVFAAGDCVDFEFRQAVTAAGMAVGAVLEIEKFLINR